MGILHTRRLIEPRHTFVVLAVLILLPLGTFAQENNTLASDSQNTEQSSGEAVVDTKPYETELLQGDTVAGDFVMGPGKVELELNPGESKTFELLVTNRMGEEKTFRLSVEDMTGTNDPAQPVLLLGDDTGPYTLKDYINISDYTFSLQNNERARVPVTVSLPANAEAGGRYGSVLVSTVSRDAEPAIGGDTKPSSAIVSRVGTLFFITTPGDTDISGALQSFTTTPEKSVFFNGPINFGIVFENTGSVHLNPYGEIQIVNMLGDEVGFVELDPWFAMPQSLRTREISWDRDFLFGKYTATAFINRGYDDVVDEISFSFWVIPWKIILITFGSLFLFFLVLRYVISHFEFKRKK